MALYNQVNGEHVLLSAEDEATARANPAILIGNIDGDDCILTTEQTSILQEIWNNPVPVVYVVTPRQARLALFNAGLLDAVDTAITNAGGTIQITWDYATEIRSDDPDLTSIAASLGMTQTQIDNLFQQASTL